jgi:hypothetical protein
MCGLEWNLYSPVSPSNFYSSSWHDLPHASAICVLGQTWREVERHHTLMHVVCMTLNPQRRSKSGSRVAVSRLPLLWQGQHGQYGQCGLAEQLVFDSSRSSTSFFVPTSRLILNHTLTAIQWVQEALSLCV